MALSAYKPATRNANKHTARGMGALEKSIQSDGWIGAMTTAADGEMIAGSARIETAAQVFGVDAEPIVIHSDGSKPIVVIRDDIPTADDKRAQRLALADNRIHTLDLDWDVPTLASFDADVLGDLWTPAELSDLGQKWAGKAEPANDPNAEWEGMPEFEQKDLMPFRSVLVHVESADDLNALAELLDQTITDKTKSVWYPKHERANLANTIFDES